MSVEHEKNNSSLSNADDVKGLGASVPFPTHYDPSLLEAFGNRYPGRTYTVTLECPEVTCLCPKTGQPDFASIVIEYVPELHLVESKSLKLYLGSFRNEGIFHEDLVNRIAEDLIELLDPTTLTVTGKFASRGGITITPRRDYRKESDGR